MEFKYQFFNSAGYFALELFVAHPDGKVEFWDYLAVENIAQGFSIMENMRKNSGGMMHFAPMHFAPM